MAEQDTRPDADGAPDEGTETDVRGHSLMEEFARDAARERARDADRWSRQELLARGGRERPATRRRLRDVLRGR